MVVVKMIGKYRLTRLKFKKNHFVFQVSVNIRTLGEPNFYDTFTIKDLTQLLKQNFAK